MAVHELLLLRAISIIGYVNLIRLTIKLYLFYRGVYREYSFLVLLKFPNFLLNVFYIFIKSKNFKTIFFMKIEKAQLGL